MPSTPYWSSTLAAGIWSANVSSNVNETVTGFSGDCGSGGGGAVTVRLVVAVEEGWPTVLEPSPKSNRWLLMPRSSGGGVGSEVTVRVFEVVALAPSASVTVSMTR